MEVPKGATHDRWGVVRIPCTVEHCQAFLSQFGRIARRLDRCVERSIGWVQLAAIVMFSVTTPALFSNSSSVDPLD
jgi:hypothetical protein